MGPVSASEANRGGGADGQMGVTHLSGSPSGGSPTPWWRKMWLRWRYRRAIRRGYTLPFRRKAS